MFTLSPWWFDRILYSSRYGFDSDGASKDGIIRTPSTALASGDQLYRDGYDWQGTSQYNSDTCVYDLVYSKDICRGTIFPNIELYKFIASRGSPVFGLLFIRPEDSFLYASGNGWRFVCAVCRSCCSYYLKLPFCVHSMSFLLPKVTVLCAQCVVPVVVPIT